MVGSRLGQVKFGKVMLHSYVTDMAAHVTPTIQIPNMVYGQGLTMHYASKMKNFNFQAFPYLSSPLILSLWGYFAPHFTRQSLTQLILTVTLFAKALVG